VKRFAAVILSPLACLGVLAGMWAEARGRVQPVDAEPYHKAAKAAISSLPYQLNGWIGRDEDIPEAAVKLLRPNHIVSRKYMDPLRIDHSAGLLVVQCKDSRDMLGHYPPVCYPGQGMLKVSEDRRTWDVDGLPIHGTEYVFAGEKYGHKFKTAVYNFMVIPGVGIVPDMKDVERAAEDYEQRYFGAAQFQVTLNAEMPQYDRDRVFTALMRGNTKMIQTLMSGGIQR
jgi:hypothetical protein